MQNYLQTVPKMIGWTSRNGVVWCINVGDPGTCVRACILRPRAWNAAGVEARREKEAKGKKNKGNAEPPAVCAQK